MNGALAGLVILALGDSHMVYMVSPLHDALEGEGAIVHSYGMCGAMAQDWVIKATAPCNAERHDRGAALIKAKTTQTWQINDLIERHHPNLVVIELGDNMAGYGVTPTLPRDLISSQVQEILRPVKARNLPCVWIGPPWGGRDTAFYHKTVVRTKELSQFLEHAVQPCHYIDTTALARPDEWGTRDGEHLTQAAYRKWSMGITGALVRMKGLFH